MDLDQLKEIAKGKKGFHLQKHLTLEFNKILSKRVKNEADPRLKTIIKCRSQKGTSKFLQAYPSEFDGTKIENAQFIALLKYASGLQFHGCSSNCPECNKPQDSFGDHAVSCQFTSARIAKHNFIRDVIEEGCVSAAFMTAKEIPFKDSLINAANGNRAGDLVIYNYEGLKDLFVDVTVVNPLCPSYFQAAQKPLGACAARIGEKKNKYRNVVGNNWFEVCAIESFGGISPNAIPIFKCIALRSAPRKNISYAKALNELLYKINLSLQKSNGEMLARRMGMM